jgi:transcriptional regulator with XRE-family HTH domain
MTVTEFKEAQSRLGLTNEQTAALLRVSTRTVEKWRQGVRGEIPGPVVVVFALLEHYRGAVEWLRRST